MKSTAPLFDIRSARISKVHKNVFICKKASKLNKMEFSTYPHRKQRKTWKNKDFHKVIHIIHIKTYVFGELLRGKKRTDVLASCYENVKMSKKIGFNIDF